MRRAEVIAWLTLSTLSAQATLSTAGDWGQARADERPQRQVGIHRIRERDGRGWLGLSVSVRDLFGPKDMGRLRSGFVVRVVIRVDLVRERGGQTVASAAQHAEILFDLWDERFRVQVAEHGKVREHQLAAPEQAIEAATALVRFPVADQAALGPDVGYKFRVRADLNPLADELVADVRKWMKTPGQGRTGSGDSVFGSFVSFFVNPRIDESERQLSFWSQSFRGGGP